MLPNTDGFRVHAHWLLRLPMAGIFLFHGPGKLIMPSMAAMFGLPEPIWMLVGLAEILAGVGLLFGGFKDTDLGVLATRLAGLAAIPVMLGAIFMVHWPRWSFAPSESHPMGGMEFQVLILAVAIYAFITGLRPQVKPE